MKYIGIFLYYAVGLLFSHKCFKLKHKYLKYCHKFPIKFHILIYYYLFLLLRLSTTSVGVSNSRAFLAKTGLPRGFSVSFVGAGLGLRPLLFFSSWIGSWTTASVIGCSWTIEISGCSWAWACTRSSYI